MTQTADNQKIHKRSWVARRAKALCASTWQGGVTTSPNPGKVNCPKCIAKLPARAEA